MKIRNVLSLFDGISCGQLALHKVGIEYDTYYASEIEKQPIWITQYNFPNTIQLGDVEKWRDWNIEWNKIDLLIGGSPCTNLSIAGNREGLKGEQSRLFYAYVDILNHLKKFNHNIKFLLENVESMSDSDKGIINIYMGCKPIMINSSLVSAQNRKRYYWFNWCLKKESLFGIPTCSIPQPEDKHILLKDILETGMASMNKSVTLCARDYKGMGVDTINRFLNHQPQAYACEPVRVGETGKGGQGMHIYSVDGKSTCLGGGSTFENYAYLIDDEIDLEHYVRDSDSNVIGTNAEKIVSSEAQKDDVACNHMCDYVSKKYDEFSKKKGYIPEIFSPYNMTELKEKAPTLTTSGCGPTNINGVVLFENVKSYDGIIVGRKLDEDEKVQTLTAAMGCGGGNIPAIATVSNIVDDKNNKIYKVRGKSVCLNIGNSNKHIYSINLPDGDYIIRKLTPIECERLQTVPDNYTEFGFNGTKNVKISNGARYKALGNGWTVDIISHILSFLV